MRNTHSGSALSVRAIAGTHVVALAWDLKRNRMDASKLLGFAVERTEFKTLARQTVVERYFLRGIKRFEDKDKGLPAGTYRIVNYLYWSKLGKTYRSNGASCRFV